MCPVARFERETNQGNNNKDDGHGDDVHDDGGHGHGHPNLPIESELGDVLAIEDQSRVCPILVKSNYFQYW